MTKYFKGNIIDVNNLPNYNYELDIIKIYPDCKESYHVLNISSHNALLYFKKYSSRDLKKLVLTIKGIISFDITDSEKQELNDIMIKVFSPSIDKFLDNEIIYEKLYDKDGHTYGKELITGNIFPICTKYSSFDIKYSQQNMDKVYYDIDTGEAYDLIRTIERYGICDSSQKQYELKRDDYIKLEYAHSVHLYDIYFANKMHQFVVSNEGFAFDICLSPKIRFSTNQRVDYVVTGNTIASELEVKEYFNKFEKGFRRKKLEREYINKINNLALSNYLGEIHFVSDYRFIKERVNESNITREMQELEFILTKLKNVSREDYDALNKEYLEILNQDDKGLHISTLSINSVISLQERAKLAFMCHGGNIKNIISYLEKEVNNYLENYNDGGIEETKISIKDLDQLSSHFLNSKNSYTIKEQNEILRCLSLLYFFEIYENKDILNSDDLKNSYIADNIKRILVVIDILHDEGIIKYIPSSLYDITSLDEFLDFIKKIEFNGVIVSDGNHLIKKMQQ